MNADFDPDSPWLLSRVTWTPRSGHVVTVTGDYLEATATTPVLTCGMYEICAALGLPEPNDEHALAISALVDPQLARREWAEVVCPEGHFRIELVEP